MSYNYTLKYRTFDQMLDDVRVDFPNLDKNIEPQQLLKVARKCNYDLGLRIQQTREGVVEIENGVGKLPDDFHVLNYALLCLSQHVTTGPAPSGTWIEERPYNSGTDVVNVCTPPKVNCHICQPNPCQCTPCATENACNTAVNDPAQPYGDPCHKPRVYLNCKGECYELVQIVKTGHVYTYSELIPIKIIAGKESVDCACPNTQSTCADKAWIKDGFLYTSVNTCKIYVNYQGDMVDDDGNIIVPDHAALNDFYEYAMKKRILENMIMNDETVTQIKLQLVMDGFKTSRIQSMTIVNTPNFSEMNAVFDANRKAQYHKYYSMFKSLGAWKQR